MTTTDHTKRPTILDGAHQVGVNDELMTVPQVLAVLGKVSRRTFYRWRELGIGPACIKLPNNELRIWRSDLNAWLDDRRERAA